MSLNSIIDLDPESTLAVFGGSEANLRLGLETLLGCSIPAAVRASMRNSPATLSLMVLERKLAASKGAMDTLGNRIAGLHRQLEHFDLQSETLLSAMAGIYVDVISPLGPRIQVTGSLPCCKARRCRRKFAQRCWRVFAPRCSGIRWAADVCSLCFPVIVWLTQSKFLLI